MKPILYMVIPCYNEEKVLPKTSNMFLKELCLLIDKKKISSESKILFVNDGSKDTTWEIIKNLAENEKHYRGISLSRNRGHQNAVLAGLMEAKDRCDITISIDCDGQDDIHAMEEMVDEYLAGAEVVYGVRKERKSDTFFKRFTAESFYRFMNIMGAEVVFNHADYRLISSRVLKEFAEYKEVNLFLRGLIPLVGFKSSSVYYDRHERIAGESHYPLKKMISLAMDGITSLSVKPLRMIACLGACILLLGILSAVGGVVAYFLGVAYIEVTVLILTLICVNFFIGGVQLISLSVVGEYIGKIYLEVKHRPRYIISERTE